MTSRSLFLVLSLILAGMPNAIPDTLVVMTFNLRYSSAPETNPDNTWENPSQSPERREVALAVITNRLPHIVGLQEGELDQLSYLATNLPARYLFEKQRPSGGSGNEHAAFAYDTNVLELLDTGVFSLGNSPGGSYWNNTPGTGFDPHDFFPDLNFAFPRLALRGRFRWRNTGQEFLFYTTHFDTFNSANDGEAQVKSAYLIVDDALARTERMPLSPWAIAVGDFNSSQNNRAWKHFTGTYETNGIVGDFTDSWEQVHGTFTDAGTYHDFNGGTLPGNERIDWILHRGGFTATQVVIETHSEVATGCGTCPRTQYPSDHYPVLAHLAFPPVAPDYDRDGLPDEAELASTNSRAADADTDGDELVDGQEDLNGDGVLDGGESDPTNGTDTQQPTDIRHYQMDGVLDFPAELLASHGLDLYWRFDGRYLYVATYDAGDGSDHFIYVVTNPTEAVAVNWAKAGQVAQWSAFLADENDSGFHGWFDSSQVLITNVFKARSATYFENDGWLEGVLDAAALFGAGFTNALYLAAAPYETSDGGALFPAAQVPEGNGDGDILGTNEYVCVQPGDLDGDGISDRADPDRDGDHLPDAWEVAFGMDPSDPSGLDGGEGDIDRDGQDNQSELYSGTDPTNPVSVLKVARAERTPSDVVISWPAVYEMPYRVSATAAAAFSNRMTWAAVGTNVNSSLFPVDTNELAVAGPDWPGMFYRVELIP